MTEVQRRGRPRNEDRKKIDARLISEARKLFFEKGYGHTTMAAVAAAARVSNTTLYSRFPSKAALFQAMVTHEINLWGSGDFRTPVSPDLDLEGLLLTYGDLAIRAGSSTSFGQIDRLLHSESERFPELGVVAAARMDLGVRWLAQEIEARSAREGRVCGRPNELARFYLNVLGGWMAQNLVTNHTPSPEERRDWLNRSVAMVMAAERAW